MKTISSVSFKKIESKNSLNIIDLRPSHDFKKRNIPSSINIKESVLLKNPSLFLSKDKVYYLICTKGYSSMKVSTTLNNLGYNTISVSGGFNEYIKS